MPYNLLLLPLLGGFLLLHRLEATNFRAQRLDGYRLLFEAALFGVALSVFARFLVEATSSFAWRNKIGAWWWDLAPFPYSDTAVIALLLAAVIPEIVNRIVPRERAKAWAIKRSGDGLTRLLSESIAASSLVSLTMGNMKWYVGYVQGLPNLIPQDTYLRLTPIISGYRDKQTLQTVRTVFYSDVIERRPDVDLAIVLPVSEIKSAAFFDEDLYEDFTGPVVNQADSNPSGR